MKKDKSYLNSSIRKVGKFYQSKVRPFSYIDIIPEENGWINTVRYLPADYDLCYCKVEGQEVPIAGWHTGISWDGRRFKENFNVTHWKMNYDF